MKHLPKYTLGMGDRFGHQGEAQLSAVKAAGEHGVPLCPVWNKSHREHTLIGTKPEDLRAEADAAVESLNWTSPYFVDADHIGLETVDGFIPASDFFTLDVAHEIGRPADPESIEAFLHRRSSLAGTHSLPSLEVPVEITLPDLERTARKYLRAVKEAGRIYRRVADAKGADSFVTEVSIDEADVPQTPVELLIILAMVADEGVPTQTIAPKFTGRFNKGVDYVGDLGTFEQDFDAVLAVLRYAAREFGLPDTLKVSVHSGSDKFSLYPIINRLLVRHGAGLHLKTAGTTWLEEVAGLAASGGEGLDIAKEIYATALPMAEELIRPYKPVVDIDVSRLPAITEVCGWDSRLFVEVLNHEPSCPAYDAAFRQFMHVSFKVAAGMRTRYTDALKANRELVGRRVRDNLLKRHILPLFPSSAPVS